VVGVLAVDDRVNRVNTHHDLAANKKAGQPKGILLLNTEAQVEVAGAQHYVGWTVFYSMHPPFLSYFLPLLLDPDWQSWLPSQTASIHPME
jgi:hypothetical protein